MRAPPKVYVAMSYIQRCDAVEGGWDKTRELNSQEELVRKNALEYLNRYFLGDFFDIETHKRKRKKEKGDDESEVKV